MDFIERAQGITAIECDKNSYLKDTLQSVCLLAEDGLNLTFTHRSFQEYFAARFIAEAPLKIQKKLISKYAEYVRFDSVFALLHEMLPDLMEQEFIRPELARMFKVLGVAKKVSAMSHLNYLRANYDYFEVSKDSLIAFRNVERKAPFSTLVSFTLKTCGRLVPMSNHKAPEENFKYIQKKYLQTGRAVQFKLEDLTVGAAFYKDLSERGEYFSIATLQRVKDIHLALINKSKKREVSLENILGK